MQPAKLPAGQESPSERGSTQALPSQVMQISPKYEQLYEKMCLKQQPLLDCLQIWYCIRTDFALFIAIAIFQSLHGVNSLIFLRKCVSNICVRRRK